MNQKPKADLALMFCSLIWGVSFVVVKNVLDESSVFLFLAVRFSIAALIMAFLQMQVIRRIETQEIFAGMRLAFFMFAGYCFQTAGLQYTTASNSGFVTGSSVVLVPLLLAVFWGRRLTRWIYLGAFAALIGLYFLTVPAEGLRYLNRGDVLTFVGSGFYAVHIILVGEYTQEHSVRALSLIQVAGCALMAWPLTGFTAAIHWQPARFSGRWELWLGHRDLRGVRDGGGVHRAVVGAAIYFAGACRDSFCVGARVRGDYFVSGAARAVVGARDEGRRLGGRGNRACGIAGRSDGARIRRTGV